MPCDSRKHLKEERDAAIERGAEVCSYVTVLMAWGQALDRARQAAERDAAEQRALAEGFAAELSKWGEWAARIGVKVDEIYALIIPAEAESPQGGQEEGD